MIFLDNASTTKPYDFVSELINFYNDKMYFNPSAPYKGAVDVYSAMKKSRDEIGDVLGCKSQNIFFTSGGTESNNLTIFGAVKNNRGNVICSSYEHSAVYNAFEKLKNSGYDVRYANISANGKVDIEHLLSLVDENTIFVSIMQVNNEIGTVNDIKEICKLVKEKNKNIIFHSDGVQSFGKMPIDISDLNIDAFSFSSHKIHGVKGVGGLYLKNPNKFTPLIYGGGQESGMRSGTENTGGIITFGKCAIKATEEIQKSNNRYIAFKEHIVNGIKGVSDIKINTPIIDKVNSIFNIAVKDVKGEVMLHALESKNIYVGTGSACSTKKKQSRTLTSIGLAKEYSDGAIRLSFGVFNSLCEIEQFTKEFKTLISELRKLKRK